MITVHILSIFGDSVKTYLDASIMKRAQEKGLFRYFIHNLTDWTVKNTRRVDDRPYGGGSGTILTIEPLVLAIEDLEARFGNMKILYPSPRWTILKQEYFEKEVWNENLQYCIICGHYEWIDERIFSLFPIESFSLGEYVLSSGELASMVWIDAFVRLIPGVISETSLKEESYSPWLNRKKEYPQYSRPEKYRELTVPQVLLSGDRKKIDEWKKENVTDN